MMDLSTNEVTLFTAALTFVTTVVGSYIAYSKSKGDATTALRADLFRLNESLKEETQKLRVRMGNLEDELHAKTRVILKLETTIEVIRRVVLREFGARLEDLLVKHGVNDEDKRPGA